MKSIYELDLNELMKRKLMIKKLSYLCIILGVLYILLSLLFYLEFGYVVLPLMLFIDGIVILLLAIWPNNVGLLIYLKQRGI